MMENGSDWWDHYKAEFNPYFPRQVIRSFLQHAVSPEADSEALRCIQQYYQTPKYQLSGHRIIEN